MFDINNFVIDRAIRGVMFNGSTHEAMWALPEIEEPQLTVGADTVDAVDAMGAPIMTFNRAKTAEFSASNSILDLSLLAAQGGLDKNVASNANRYNAPIFDELTVAEADKLTLSRTPVVPDGETYGCKFVYRMNGDGTLGEKFTASTTVSANTFTISDNVLTFNTGVAAIGQKFWAYYEYEASGAANHGAVEIKNTAKNFPKAGEFVLEVLGADPCDQDTLYFAYLIFPNAKLASDFDLTFATDSKHPFKLKANQKYCDGEKVLFRLVVPEAAVAA